MANWGLALAKGLGMAVQTENTRYAEQIKENRIIAKQRYNKQVEEDDASFEKESAYRERINSHLGKKSKDGKYPNKNNNAISQIILTRQALEQGYTGAGLDTAVKTMMKQQEGKELDLSFLGKELTAPKYTPNGWEEHMAKTKRGPLSKLMGEGINSLFSKDSTEPGATPPATGETTGETTVETTVEPKVNFGTSTAIPSTEFNQYGETRSLYNSMGKEFRVFNQENKAGEFTIINGQMVIAPDGLSKDKPEVAEGIKLGVNTEWLSQPNGKPILVDFTGEFPADANTGKQIDITGFIPITEKDQPTLKNFRDPKSGDIKVYTTLNGKIFDGEEQITTPLIMLGDASADAKDKTKAKWVIYQNSNNVAETVTLLVSEAGEITDSNGDKATIPEGYNLTTAIPYKVGSEALVAVSAANVKQYLMKNGDIITVDLRKNPPVQFATTIEVNLDGAQTVGMIPGSSKWGASETFINVDDETEKAVRGTKGLDGHYYARGEDADGNEFNQKLGSNYIVSRATDNSKDLTNRGQLGAVIKEMSTRQAINRRMMRSIGKIYKLTKSDNDATASLSTAAASAVVTTAAEIGSLSKMIAAGLTADGTITAKDLEAVNNHKNTYLSQMQSSTFIDDDSPLLDKVTESKELRGAIVELAFLKLMVLGQKGQSVSVKEFDAVLKSLAGNSSDPRVLGKRMVSLVGDLQNSISDQYASVSQLYQEDVETNYPQSSIQQFVIDIALESGMDLSEDKKPVVDKEPVVDSAVALIAQFVANDPDWAENLKGITEDPNTTLSELETLKQYTTDADQLSLINRAIAAKGGK